MSFVNFTAHEVSIISDADYNPSIRKYEMGENGRIVMVLPAASRADMNYAAQEEEVLEGVVLKSAPHCISIQFEGKEVDTKDFLALLDSRSIDVAVFSGIMAAHLHSVIVAENLQIKCRIAAPGPMVFGETAIAGCNGLLCY